MTDQAAQPPTAPDGIPSQLPDEAMPELGQLQRDWSAALAGMLAAWPDQSKPISDQVLDRIRLHAVSGDLAGVDGITVPSHDLAAWIEAETLSVASLAADRARAEAAAQDVELAKGIPDRSLLAAAAQVTAGTLVAGLIMSATREALRVWPGRNASPQRITDSVAEHLDSLTTAQPEYVLGGNLTGGQREGRMATARQGPGAALYASEVLDTNTCVYCREVDKRWLGNLDDPSEPWLLTYPVRGYVDCLGRDRCRGQIVYIWRGGSDWKKWIEKEPIRP